MFCIYLLSKISIFPSSPPMNPRAPQTNPIFSHPKNTLIATGYESVISVVHEKETLGEGRLARGLGLIAFFLWRREWQTIIIYV